MSTDYSTTIEIEGRTIRTLQDILPSTPGLRALFVAKTPAPISVDAGHYFQGKQGTMFWNKLRTYGVFSPKTTYCDESFLDHGFGITDIVKCPRSFGNEPSQEEYNEGAQRILNLITEHNPLVVVFVYKRVLDNILKISFHDKEKSCYGFNPLQETRFGSKVFVFPMPGTPCKKETAHQAMKALELVLSK